MKHYLNSHPSICMLSQDDNYLSYQWNTMDAVMYNNMWNRSEDVNCRNKPIWGEKSGGYFFHPEAPERVRYVLPNAKFIVFFRNPIDRAYSHWWMDFCKGRTNESFAQWIESCPSSPKGCSYLVRGQYAQFLRPWFQKFPRDRFLLFSSEEMFNDTTQVLFKIENFLGVKHYDYSQVNVVWGSSPTCTRLLGERPSIDPDLRSRLLSKFKPYNQELYDLIGRDYGWH